MRKEFWGTSSYMLVIGVSLQQRMPMGFINKNVAQGNILSGTCQITSGGQFRATKKKKKKSSKSGGVSQLERYQWSGGGSRSTWHTRSV